MGFCVCSCRRRRGPGAGGWGLGAAPRPPPARPRPPERWPAFPPRGPDRPLPAALFLKKISKFPWAQLSLALPPLPPSSPCSVRKGGCSLQGDPFVRPGEQDAHKARPAGKAETEGPGAPAGNVSRTRTGLCAGGGGAAGVRSPGSPSGAPVAPLLRPEAGAQEAHVGV